MYCTRILAILVVTLTAGCSGGTSSTEKAAELPLTATDETAEASQPQFHAFNGSGLSIGSALGVSDTTETSEFSAPPVDIPQQELSTQQPFITLPVAEEVVEEPPVDSLSAEPQQQSLTESALTQGVVSGVEQNAVETDGGPTAAEESTDVVGSASEPPSAPDQTAAAEGQDIEVDAASSPASLTETAVAPVVEAPTVPAPTIGSGFPSSTAMVEETLPGSDIALPAYRETVSGTVQSVTLTRISTPAEFQGNATHQYSKRTAFNSDETLIEVGDAVIDRETLAIVNPYVPVSTERVWSNLQPDILYGIRYQPDPNVFASVNVRTNSYTILRTFSDYNRCALGDSEGSLSNNDQRVVIACDERASGRRVLIAYDIATDTILGTLIAQSNYNWAGFSQSGNYIVVENNTYPDPSPHIIVYDAAFQSPRHLGSPGHGDFGYDDNGDEVYVMIRWDVIWYVRLRDGARVDLSISNAENPIGHGHISCRNLDRPGWCYFSAHKDSRLGAVRISEHSSVVEHWGFHRSTSSSYNAEPKASVSRSGRQLVFTSDWFGQTDNSDFLLSLPD